MAYLRQYVERFLPLIEAELQAIVDLTSGPGLQEYRRMLTYHMGWEGPGAGPAAAGKRLRPLLTLLACEAAGGDFRRALPAAAAVELIHNFSLIHDDIQDNSRVRRGRETVWVRWGRAQAINAGDALFTLAWLAGPRLLERGATAKLAVAVTRVLATSLLHITQGQHLDIEFETRAAVSVPEYMEMIGGKTAELLAGAVEVGALLAGAPPGTVSAYRAFGQQLGLAFQIQDDLLGIWGEPDVTGKSAASDLQTRKKSLPVVYGMAHSPDFARRCALPPSPDEDLTPLIGALQAAGADTYARSQSERLTNAALLHLQDASPLPEPGLALRELAARLTGRKT
ncbi:MAG: polyprenyl synthetase family protein [Chloroflexi bacterium]|nr:polyprenyl synthetase family protein [Chloroflexota bacterium]